MCIPLVDAGQVGKVGAVVSCCFSQFYELFLTFLIIVFFLSLVPGLFLVVFIFDGALLTYVTVEASEMPECRTSLISMMTSKLDFNKG